MRIVQLSDLHLTGDARPLYGTVDTEAALHTALTRAAALRPVPDLLVISGDLANGAAAAYGRLHAALAGLPFPSALMPGNHDGRDELRRAFPAQAWSGDPLCCQCLEREGGRLLLLDSTIPGEEAGEVGEAQLRWLEAACRDERPALLFMHHPPFAIGIPGMDAIRCRGEDGLRDWLAGKPQVEALLCGHVHRHASTTFAGRPALTAPSTAHQIALQDGPLAYTEEAGGFLVHDWQPGARLLTLYLPSAAAPVHVYRD